ncbi:MAG: hypothetical protein IPK66_07725 [Rhodospirillales bacterium]|nr:hypothetical protein [Rhodospirillales bacterium]
MGLAALACVAMLLSGCTGMTDTQQRSLTGGAAGAAGGAAIGALAGSAAWGAAIGGASGLAGGYLYDQYKKSQEDAYQKGVQAGRSGQ